MLTADTTISGDAITPSRAVRLQLPEVNQAAPRPEYYDFAQIILKAMLRKKLSQSDLARAIWGDTKDARGYKVARNRDRITHYLKGRAYPEPGNLKKLAKALDLEIEALQVEKPVKGVAKIQGGSADVQLHILATEPTQCLLIVQKLLPTQLGLKIVQLINEADMDPRSRIRGFDDTLAP